MNSILKNTSTTKTTSSTSPRTGSLGDNISNKTKSVSRPQQKSTQRKARQCYSCQLPCLRTDRSLIRALGHLYHYDCFTCNDCQKLVADKFYALNTSRDTTSFKIVCEEHYHAQVGGGGALCQKCQQPIKTNQQFCRHCQNPYSCPGCSQQSTDFEEICYEHENQGYCLLHFSEIKEIQCSGCQQAILEKFVEHKHFPGKKWHPECYMIFKFWNVRLVDTLHFTDGTTKLSTQQLKVQQSTMERKVNRIWVDLSSFEESSATCISDMLLLVAAGAYMEGFRMASQFAVHLKVLYIALNDIQQQLVQNGEVLPCNKESKTVCDQVIRFFDLLAQSDDKKTDSIKDNNRDVTQELLTLVTSLAQNFKTLIRIGLAGALQLERDYYSLKAIPEFLNNLLELDRKRVWVGGRYWFKEDPFPDLLDTVSQYSNTTSHANQHQDILWDRCHSCQKPIEDDCYQYDGRFRWHPSCFVCSRCQNVFINLTTVHFSTTSPTGSHVLLCNQCSSTTVTNQQIIQGTAAPSLFTHMTQLQNYLYILKLALARLYLAMNSSAPIDKHLGIYNPKTYNNNSLMSYTGTTISPSTAIPFIINDTCYNNSPPHHQQKPLRRRSLLGSINFGVIKRVKAADLDRNIDHTKNENTFSSATASVHESKHNYHHQNQNMENSAQLYIQQLQNNSTSIISPTTTQPTCSSATSEADKHGLFSVTRRLSTNTRQRFGSLRYSRSQKRASDGSSVHDEFGQQLDHEQQQKQQRQYEHQYQQQSSQVARNKSLLRKKSTDTQIQSLPQTISRTTVDKSPIPANRLNLYEHLLQLSPHQYLLVSYIAAKSIKTFFPDMYTTNEWMKLVDLQKSTLWGKLKTRIRTSQAPSPDQQPSLKVFGGPLSLLTSDTYQHDQQPKNQALALKRYIVTNNTDTTKPDGNRSQSAIQEIITCFTSIHCKVPIFIQHCLLTLLQRDLSVEGIFRKNGNIRELKQLEDAIDNDISDDNSLMIELLSMQTSIQLAALLKRYLHQLPEPLLTYRLYPVFVAATGLETEEQVRSALHLACCMLPKENRDTMQVIFHVLHHISTYKDQNKMDIHNIARIIAPSVLHNLKSTTSTTQMHQGTSPSPSSSSTSTNINIVADRIPSKEINVVNKLIKYHGYFGKTPFEMLPFVSDHHLVEWLTRIDSKHFLKHYSHSAQQVLNSPSRSRRGDYPCTPTTPDVPDWPIDTSPSPTIPSRNHSTNMRDSSFRRQSTAATPFINFEPDTTSSSSSIARSFNRQPLSQSKQQI